jgi:two-component system cell cycle sensor histidine kinase/response regulator CckA
MDDLSVESRVETLVNAVKKASPTDEFLGIDRTGADDALDRLVDEIDALLARFGERMKAFQSAQEALLKLQVRGDEEANTLSREHRLLLDALKENVPDKIYFKDAQGRFVHLSKARVKAFDLISAGEVVGKTDFDLFTEDHARTAFEDEQRIIRTGEPIINKEEKETWRDQPSTWVLTTKMPLRDEQGTIVGTFGISRSITERKRAEERYQLLFNCIDDAVLVYGLTPDGRPDTITEVNDIACEKLGYARSELLCMNPLDLLPPETTATAIDMMVRLKSERRTVWESSYVTRTGLQVPVEISSHLFDVSGEQAVLSAFRDIARRKQLEENLEREKALLMTLIDNLPDHVSVKDTESRFLITNASNALVMGLERPQDAIGKTDFDFYPAEEAARYMADERNLMQAGTPLINKEEESKDPEGRTRFTLTSKVPLRNARGEVVGVVCTGRDITERKEAELALHQEAIRRRIFFEEAADGIAVIGDGLTVVDANRSFASMLGYSSEEIRRLRAWDWDALHPTEESFRKQWRTRPPTRGRFETQHRRKDGSIFDVEVTFNPATTSSGEIQVYCVCRDISERKQANERIQDLARLTDESPHPVIRVSLDGAVLYANPAGKSLLGSWTEATGGSVPGEHLPELLQAWERNERRKIETQEASHALELTITPIRSRGYINLYGRDVTEEKSLAEKFLQAQKMEAVGRLAGGIAHDFNNLLTVIVGYCEIARQELVEESPVQTRIDEIAKATKRAASLTSKLLAFSRKQVLMPRVISVNDLLKAAQGMIARLVGEDLEIETLLDAEAGNIRADPGQIEQVLMNLAVNARDAMPEGGKLTIKTSRRTLGDDYVLEHPGARAGDYVQVSVSDTGHGMDRDVLSHLFEPFFTTKDVSKGTGLGLSTVYGIVQQSNGQITCSSEPGKGTTFTILLPRTTQASEHAAAPVEEDVVFHGSETILLVEDDDTVRRLTQTMLENVGYKVIAALGGVEALAAMKREQNKVDLLVTDVVMPQMNGQELAQKLLLINSKLKILFLSGYAQDLFRHHGMLDPGVDFLHKPFTSREMLTKIREILNRR